MVRHSVSKNVLFLQEKRETLHIRIITMSPTRIRARKMNQLETWVAVLPPSEASLKENFGTIPGINVL